MDVWFEIAQAKFEIFLEQKLEIYGESVAALGPLPEEAAILGENLKALPDTFIDSIHERIEKTYIDLPNGYEVTEEESADCPSALYGELTSVGVLQMHKLMEDFGATSATGGDGTPTFLDLGSGTGKVPIELALRAPEMNTVGVEFIQSRNDVGTVALKLMSMEDDEYVDNLKSRVKLICGDFLELPNADVCENVTSMFCCGVGFSEEFCLKICDRIVAGFPKLKICVLLFRAPPPHELVMPAEGKSVTLEHVNTTWMNETPAMLIKFDR